MEFSGEFVGALDFLQGRGVQVESAKEWNRTFHSRQMLLGCNGHGQLVLKRLTLPHVEPYYTAEELKRVVEAYHSGLQELGIRTPKLYELLVVGKDLFELASLEGTDFQQFVCRLSDEEGLRYMRILVSLLNGVLGQEGEYFRVGIDLRLQNFAISTEQQALPVFIDFHPPLVDLDGEYHVHIPRPPAGSEGYYSDLERKFTPAGVMRRLFFSVAAVRREWALQFWDILKGSLEREVFLRVQDSLKDMPTLHFGDLTRDRKKELIVMTEDRDMLRELGALILPCRDQSSRDQDMSMVFGLTRRDADADAGGAFPGTYQERVAKLRRWLLDCL